MKVFSYVSFHVYSKTYKISDFFGYISNRNVYCNMKQKNKYIYIIFRIKNTILGLLFFVILIQNLSLTIKKSITMKNRFFKVFEASCRLSVSLSLSLSTVHDYNRLYTHSLLLASKIFNVGGTVQSVVCLFHFLTRTKKCVLINAFDESATLRIEKWFFIG